MDPEPVLTNVTIVHQALDVCLQQLTSSLDEDLADVDEYERGVMDETGHPISLSVR